jgi:hypothetical protein
MESRVGRARIRQSITAPTSKARTAAHVYFRRSPIAAEAGGYGFALKPGAPAAERAWRPYYRDILLHQLLVFGVCFSNLKSQNQKVVVRSDGDTAKGLITALPRYGKGLVWPQAALAV